MIAVDDPQVSRFVFHPRPEGFGPPPAGLATKTASDGAAICGYLHPNKDSNTLMLFFHGNGEIAADYAALAHLYTACGVSFWVVDYRGYGSSTGSPSYSDMFTDAESVLDDVPAVEAAVGRSFSRVVIMGRSLGSAPALYLADVRSEGIDALVLDSPFADGPALIRRLGGPEVDLSLTPAIVDNEARIKGCRQPTLIIHGAEDWIIPVADAESLHRACPSEQKRLIRVPGAGHNDLLVKGFPVYFSEIKSLCESTGAANR